MVVILPVAAQLQPGAPGRQGVFRREAAGALPRQQLLQQLETLQSTHAAVSREVELRVLGSASTALHPSRLAEHRWHVLPRCSAACCNCQV